MAELPPAPRITPLQREWLLELGMQRPVLARWMAPAGPVEAPAPGTARVVPDVAAVPASVGSVSAVPAPVVRARAIVPTAGQSAGPVAAPPAGDLAGLREQVRQCRACSLCEGRSQAVFGEGAHDAPDWLVVGEAPGDRDDREGRPFQGDAGDLLAGMLAAMGVKTDGKVFFTNLVKCRPLGNRPPSADEIAACLPYLKRQVALLAPRRILALGRLPAQVLTGGEAGLDQLRGTVHAFEDEGGRRIPLVVTHHPASLLLQPQHKPDAWRDLILARGVAA